MYLNQISKPNVSTELARELTHRIYGLEVTYIKKMVSFDDQNFHIKVSKEHSNPHITNVPDDGFTLKITNTQKSVKEYFEIMHRAMMHVVKKGLQSPSPVRNLEGKTWSFETVPLLNEDQPDQSDSKKCCVHLLTFIPGSPVETVAYTKDVLFQWGRLLAEFHNAIADCPCPSLQEKNILWSLERIPEILKYMEGLDDEKTKLVLKVLEKYPKEIAENIGKLRKGFIHGDFNESNILVQVKQNEAGEDVFSVDGILDFEDAHCGSYAWDLGVLMAYSLLKCDAMDPLLGAGHALAGYLSLRSLTGLEMSLLKVLIECRLCQSLVLCAFSYRQDPNNSYLLKSSLTGWDRLRQIGSVRTDELLLKWKVIEKGYNNLHLL